MQVKQGDIDHGGVDCSATMISRSSRADNVEALAGANIVLNHKASMSIGEY